MKTTTLAAAKRFLASATTPALCTTTSTDINFRHLVSEQRAALECARSGDISGAARHSREVGRFLAKMG